MRARPEHYGLPSASAALLASFPLSPPPQPASLTSLAPPRRRRCCPGGMQMARAYQERERQSEEKRRLLELQKQQEQEEARRRAEVPPPSPLSHGALHLSLFSDHRFVAPTRTHTDAQPSAALVTTDTGTRACHSATELQKAHVYHAQRLRRSALASYHSPSRARFGRTDSHFKRSENAEDATRTRLQRGMRRAQEEGTHKKRSHCT